MALGKFTIAENLNDWNEYPGMAHWFSPRLLIKLIRKVIISAFFGQYADKRLMHAALDVVDDVAAKLRCAADGGMCASVSGPVWLDYVADLGDGFDSTYAIAYLIGQQQITVDGSTLPRASALIMGGDQVYPDASRDDYRKRMQRPYECAFPRTEAVGADHPPVFLIPGNHDWYDGLTLFLAKFCRGRDTPLGSWIARQSRSYFAIHLRDNWWVWGFDSQLGEDVDKPQADYFANIAREQMKPGSKIILCASVPTWLGADQKINTGEQRSAFYRGIDYISGILKDECPDSKIPLVLSGDIHHYSRYIASPSGTSFITAGGGGAFLHPTHGLPQTISASWVKTQQTLQIAKKKTDDGKDTDVCYPSRETSKRLIWGNWRFIIKNADFCLTLGGIYFLAAVLMLGWRGYGEGGGNGPFLARFVGQLFNFMLTPMFLLVGACFYFVLVHYADVKQELKNKVGGIHALIHLAILVLATATFSVSVANLKILPGGEIWYFLYLGIDVIAAGILGGLVWGFYLLICSVCLDGHSNDAFSAMRLNSFRHFLRIKIDGEMLTVFPIGIDKSPTRDEWEKNKSYQEGNQNAPFFVPKNELGQHHIEEPITIDANLIEPLNVLPRS